MKENSTKIKNTSIKRISYILGILIVIIIAIGCSNADDYSNLTEYEKKAKEYIDLLESSGRSVENLYLDKNIVVGEDIAPGIYDLKVKSCESNRFDIDYKSDALIKVPGRIYLISSDDSFSSKVHLVLNLGDVIKPIDVYKICKIDLIASIQNNQMANNLGYGEYIVGRDIKAGSYRISSNIKFDNEDSGFWGIRVFGFDGKQISYQTYNGLEGDKLIDLKSFQLIYIFLGNRNFTEYDNARLTFTELK